MTTLNLLNVCVNREEQTVICIIKYTWKLAAASGCLLKLSGTRCTEKKRIFSHDLSVERLNSVAWAGGGRAWAYDLTQLACTRSPQEAELNPKRRDNTGCP